MHEILQSIPRGSRVLDLGCAAGSFRASHLWTVRLDIDPQGWSSSAGMQEEEVFVVAEAGRLPLAESCVAAVICNHSLEHFPGVDAVLEEIGRVAARNAALFVSVPDSTTFSDRYCRWALRSVGHVNQFSDVRELVSRIEKATGLPHQGTRLLFSSLCFLNPHHSRGRLPGRVRWTLPGGERSLRVVSYLTRLADRFLGTRLSVYGWALYFGHMHGRPVDRESWCNVCVACGSATPSGWLEARGAIVRRRFLPDGYCCPDCKTWNLFIRDSVLGHVK